MEKASLLVVDDEASVRRLLSKVFVQDGYEVLTASGGEEAIAIAKEKKVDVAIVDLKMPDLDGIETIRRIKNINPAMFFIVITAFGEMASVKEAAELGVFDYVTKPFDLEYIKHLVGHITRGMRPKALPYVPEMKKILEGGLPPDEAKKRKFDLLKQELDEKIEELRDSEKCIDEEVCKYYKSPLPLTRLADSAKKLTGNIYFIIIVAGILLGIVSAYLYGNFSSKRLYSSTEKKSPTINDFYKTLSELKYWMRKHTEVGIESEGQKDRLDLIDKLGE